MTADLHSEITEFDHAEMSHFELLRREVFLISDLLTKVDLIQFFGNSSQFFVKIDCNCYYHPNHSLYYQVQEGCKRTWP